jgi:hypothetical protein
MIIGEMIITIIMIEADSMRIDIMIMIIRMAVTGGGMSMSIINHS